MASRYFLRFPYGIPCGLLSGSPHGIRSTQDVDDNQDSQDDAQTIQGSPSEVSKPEGERKTSLSTLPLDIIFIISGLRNKTDSTCLALAVKKFYPLHRAKYGKVDLMAGLRFFRLTIYQRIAGFFPGLIFYEPVNKFITPERRDALELKRHEEGQEQRRWEQLLRERRQRETREREEEQQRRMQRQDEISHGGAGDGF
ncbi:uncharacterized protein PAC_09236 [Phialocephala subalpina]|uniref:Uncharacterized protein n=1 Tax=Phialocephala subalpina TaxID=576137 RepID=A0A1L7X2U9_9HELO|nr:uncharacterized protein PAC_09236 [Phialocephala subalpina]